MILVATTSNLIGARLIRWILGEDASHICFVFNELEVVHSSLSGIELKFWATYKKHIRIVDRVEWPVPLALEDLIWQLLLSLHGDDGYDYKGLIGGFWIAIKFRLFKIPPPKNNEWQDKNKRLCTEVYSLIREAAPELNLPDLGDTSVITPLGIIREVRAALQISFAQA